MQPCVRPPPLGRYLPYSDETRVRRQWIRGPLSPVQANVDHLIRGDQITLNLPGQLMEEQNALYRAHPT